MNGPAPSARPALGIDVGGTKIEARLLDAAGGQIWRERIDSPSNSYPAMLQAIAGLVQRARAAAPGGQCSIGLGTPGSSTASGLIKNANTQCLNGQPFERDLSHLLGQPVSLDNDANCLAWSEASDGAGAGAGVVFAVILGTGCGGGLAVGGRVLQGPNRLAGEWGHNPMPWMAPDEPMLPCYCGQQGCVEGWLSGPAMAADHLRRTGRALTAAHIAQAAETGTDPACAATLARWHQHLARALAAIINLLDPDVIVLGGGLSQIMSTYTVVPTLWQQWVFAGGLSPAQREPVRTRLVPALHGDASGVRGAAWLGRLAC